MGKRLISDKKTKPGGGKEQKEKVPRSQGEKISTKQSDEDQALPEDFQEKDQ